MFSDYCKILSNSYKIKRTQATIVYEMFQSVGNTHFLNIDDPSDSYSQKIYRGASPLTDSIINKTPIPFRLEEAKSFFMSQIDSKKYDDLYRDFKIDTSLEKNDSVLITSIAEMFKLYNETLEDKITKTVAALYAELLSNPSAKNLETVKKEDTSLILEMQNVCPECGDKLYIDYEGVQVSNYSIINVFPDRCSYTEEKEFLKYANLTKKPDNFKIAVCKKTQQVYQATRNINIFKKLFDAKRTAKENMEFEKMLTNDTIEDTIKQLLNDLLKLNPDDFDKQELSYDPKVIDEKIPNITYLQKSNILSINEKFFPIIDNYLGSKFGKDEDDSTILGKKIKTLSKKLQDGGHAGIELIDKLSIELRTHLGNIYDLDTIKIVLYYFLQHCEVLSLETTK